MPKSGKLQIHANGDTAIAICNNKYCACKSIAETRVTVQKEDCEIDEDTGEIGKKKDTTPVGIVVSYMGNNPPEGYLSCDGATYNISEYPKLAEQIKTEFGSYNHFGGNGTSTFAVPDLKEQGRIAILHQEMVLLLECIKEQPNNLIYRVLIMI